ncbi:hypothetical protein Rhal01_02407 [Rubritalea halochordaticola]|uniref:Ice-binding protein C-terminal domain-containing protein n=2 Tax=Rubritalea halochordaticola TaxID=714537 RepID=A0ABP9V2J4_9BACT
MAATSFANAAVITTVSTELSALGGSNTQTQVLDPAGATIAITQGSTTDGGADQTLIFTVSGLTLDSFGAGDDSLVINLQLSATSSLDTVSGIGRSFEAWGVNNSLIDVGETLTFSMGTAQVNLGAGTTDIVESVVFNGFTGFDLLNVGAGETFDITGTDNSDATGVSISQNQGYLLGGGEQEQSFTYVASGTGGMRIYEVTNSFTVTTTAVPEPSSVALLGFGGLALVMRRRR